MQHVARRAPERPSRETGRLYLVATPIGNLEDITVRALRLLGEVDLIACEDTRHTAKLLRHYGIEKPTLSYHQHNEASRAGELVQRLEQGAQIILVTDAGTPVISDPGHRLVSLCLERQIPVIPIPGPSAVIAALAASGVPAGEFLFLGFLPSRPTARRKVLQNLAKESRTVVLYEAPHRLADTLSDALDCLGRRQAVLAREMTKIHEEFMRADLAELLVRVQQQPVRGEITLLIGPPLPGDAKTQESCTVSLPQRVEEMMREQQIDRKSALKLVARERGLTKRQAYKQLIGGA
ncbi:MAG: 16S rRNA (cytidine(1402)-2'-O)-methyltransferase [Acidobacteria bacterium]|nr:MAG: 16S rRNA (cytidine(1402)-2'-O)-methyltransferase [Acidobacteriota bacterium]